MSAISSQGAAAAAQSAAHNVTQGLGGGAGDIFIKITGQKSGQIKGECIREGAQDWIQVREWSWGLSQAYDNTGLPSGRRNFHTLNFTTDVEISTPLLFNSLAINENMTEVVLSCRRAGGSTARGLEILKITLTNANFRDAVISMDPHSGRQVTYKMTFEKIEAVANAYDAKGNMKTGGVTYMDNWAIN